MLHIWRNINTLVIEYTFFVVPNSNMRTPVMEVTVQYSYKKARYTIKKRSSAEISKKVTMISSFTCMVYLSKDECDSINCNPSSFFQLCPESSWTAYRNIICTMCNHMHNVIDVACPSPLHCSLYFIDAFACILHLVHVSIIFGTVIPTFWALLEKSFSVTYGPKLNLKVAYSECGCFQKNITELRPRSEIKDSGIIK